MRSTENRARWASGLAFVLLALLAVSAAPTHAAQNALDLGMPPFPRLTGPVVDDAHLLPPKVFEQLSSRLAAYARATGIQVVVVTVPTLHGYPIDYYGYQLGRHWGIGQKGKDNGVLFTVDAGEKQARIDVGYGLEGTLTDAQSFLILHNVVFPRFRAGDYAAGIVAGTDSILSALGDQHLAVQRKQVHERNGTGLLMLFVLFFALSPLLRALSRRRGGSPGYAHGGMGGGWLGWLALGMLGGGLGGGFGGGLGGGGFGGFSGGGGSFGGGGAAGSW